MTEQQPLGNDPLGRGWRWEQRWHQDRVRPLTIAIVLIWAGSVLLAGNLELFRFSWWDGWGIFLAGTGFILVIKAIILALTRYRWGAMPNLVLGIILLGVGIGITGSWRFVWPIVLMTIGLAIVVRALIRRG